MIRRLLIGAAALVAATVLLAVPASADHGEGHNGETIEVSNDADVADGETLAVELSSFIPGNTATLITCYNYPASGPNDCELSNYGEFAVVIDGDGNGSLDYVVNHVPGRCDIDNPCFIVASDGFGLDANYAAAPITFAESPASEESTTTTEATTTTEESTTTSTVTSTTSEPTDEEAQQTADDEATDDDDGTQSEGGTGWVLPVIIIAGLAALAAGLFARRKRD